MLTRSIPARSVTSLLSVVSVALAAGVITRGGKKMDDVEVPPPVNMSRSDLRSALRGAIAEMEASETASRFDISVLRRLLNIVIADDQVKLVRWR